MQSDSTMKRVAVVSYMPGHAYSDAHWPKAGLATRRSTLDTMCEGHHVKVLPLPVRKGGHLHWQQGAHWVVLEIEADVYEERDGFVTFHRGQVVFHGLAPEAREYIRERGLPVPSALPFPVVVADWARGEVGDDAVILGASGTQVRAGRYSLAYTTDGTGGVGQYGLSVSAHGDVTAGDFGLAFTRFGRRAVAGDHGVARCHECGTAGAGKLGVAITDTGGEALAGELGVAIGRMGGNATAGQEGIALACEDMGGHTGLARAGPGGIALAVGSEGRAAAETGGVMILVVGGRAHVAYVGVDGIQPNTPYRLDEGGRFVVAEPSPSP